MKRAMTVCLLAGQLALAGAKGQGEASLLEAFEYTGASLLVVEDAGVFNLEVKGYSGVSIKVEVYGSSETGRVAHSQRDRDVVIAGTGGIEIRSIGAAAPRMVIRVPSTTELDLETTTGEITVETVNGSKRLATTTGRIVVRSGKGDITARSTNGGHRFDYVEGNIRAQTTAGGIEVTNTTGLMDLRSSTGSLSGRDVKLTGTSQFETTTGRVEMDFTNPIEDLSFQLTSSSGKITLGETEVRGSVVQGAGPIRVRGRSTTGRQRYQ